MERISTVRVARGSVELFSPRVMKFLTFLTRRQAWLAPHEIARDFRLDGERVTSRTIHRWVRLLRETAGFVYYPYPRANVLGLQDVLVRVRGLRNPAVLGVLPFGASFQVEIGLADGQPFVSSGYWVPGESMDEFQGYWRAVRDLGLADGVELFQSRNTHFLFSPFQEVISPDGLAAVRGPVDNRYFEALVKRHLGEKFEVRVGDTIAKAPLVIPLIMEHIWVHFSSQQVWEAIRAKGEEPIRAYLKGSRARALERPGAALRLLQEQWRALLEDFETVFMQPRVLFNWTPLRNAIWVSLFLKPGSLERIAEAAVRASEKSIVTSLKPGVGYEERCLITCFCPSDQLLPLLEVVRDYHRDVSPPIVALQDLKATFDMFQPSWCRVDWRLFDPATLSWRFDGDEYVERLKGLKAAAR